MYLSIADHIQPICIFHHRRMQLVVDQITWFKATGWGLTSTDLNTKSSRVLMELNLYRRLKNDCARIFKQNFLSGQICAGNDDGNLCRGDSGGPQGRYVLIFGMKRFVQMGIASFTYENCSKVSILTDVVRYGRWIKKVVDWYGR